MEQSRIIYVMKNIPLGKLKGIKVVRSVLRGDIWTEDCKEKQQWVQSKMLISLSSSRVRMKTSYLGQSSEEDERVMKGIWWQVGRNIS